MTQEENKTEHIQLLYLRVFSKNSRFKDQDINFGGPLRFEFDIHSNTLNIKENEQYIDAFFQKNEERDCGILCNITGVVGENGSGKTNLFQTIYNAISGNLNTIESPFIISFLKNNKSVYTYRSNINKFRIIDNGITKYKIYKPIERHTTYVKHYIGIKSVKYPNLPEKDKLLKMYYKNYLEPYSFNIEKPYQDIDLSLQWTLWQHEYRTQQEKINQSKSQSTRDYPIHSINYFKSEEISDAIKFISKYRNENFKIFPLPSTLELKTLVRNNFEKKIRSEFNSKIKENTNKEGEEFINNILKWLDFFNSWKYSKDKYISIKEKLLTNAVINYYFEILLFYFQTFHNNPNIEINKNLNNIIDICEFLINEIQNKIINQNIVRNPKTNELTDLGLPKIEKYISYLKDLNLKDILYDDIDLYLSKTAFTAIELDIKSKSNNVDTFIRNYFESIMYSSYINYSWGESLSAGENAYLNIFSKFNKHTNIEHYQNVLIFIDEGETNLHPEWQRKFIDSLVEIFPKIFTIDNNKAKINIQIILSTHSPFLLSDLPLSNVILLEKNGKSTIVQSGLSDHKQTFGANIHTLLSDSFFMKEGLMGEFAKNKLNEVIDYLIGNKPLSKNESDRLKEMNNIKKIIDMTGEPIIRNKLMTMYKQKFDSELERRVANLEKEIFRKKHDKDQTE